MSQIKKVLISFLAIVSVLAFLASASAYTVSGNLADITEIKVNELTVGTSGDIGIVAGETITVKVIFKSHVSASDVRIRAEIDGEKTDVYDKTDYFDVEAGKIYSKTLVLKVPYELSNEVSRNLPLTIKVWNGDYSTETNGVTLRVQRASYNADILSIFASNTINAGEIVPVDMVLKNTGYNNLNDMYVTVKIPALKLEKSAYFGDLVSIKDPANENDEDTVGGRIYLRIPYDAAAGKYALEVDVSNEDFSESETKEITVNNDFPESVMKTSSGLLFINPTNALQLYKVVLPSGEENIVSVPAGLTKSVDVRATGENYVVTVLKVNGEVVNSLTFNSSEQAALGSPVIVLTVILAIVFLVLLVILIVLVTRKPAKTEELGESYY